MTRLVVPSDSLQSTDRPIIIPVPPVSEFPATTLGVWRFNQSLEDAVGSEDFNPDTGSALFKKFNKFELLPNRVESRYGLEFEEDQFYHITPSYVFSEDFTLSFWYFSPGLIGFTRHATTRDLEPKVAPIIAKANSSQTSSRTSLTNASFVVTEIGFSKTKNAIRVYLSSGSGDPTHVIESESFAPGLHHVLMTFSKSRGRFRIDIDGKSGIQHSAPIVSLSSSSPFFINRVVPGFLSHKTSQVGAYIFDLLFTTIVSLDNESLKAFRYGYEHITFETLFDTRFSYFGMSYAQPSTVSTTHMVVEGGNIFAARSNGKIAKGARPIWDKEFNYPDTQRVSLLNTSKTDPPADDGNGGTSVTGNSRFLELTSDGIHLRGVSIRI